MAVLGDLLHRTLDLVAPVAVAAAEVLRVADLLAVLGRGGAVVLPVLLLRRPLLLAGLIPLLSPSPCS